MNLPLSVKPTDSNGPERIASAPSMALFAAAFAACIVFVTLWIGALESRALIEPDEGRYAEIAREMALTGDFVTPRLDGLVYFEKPPLQYWVTAVAYKIFGLYNWTARLWSLLTGIAGIALCILAGQRLFSPRAGWYAGLVLASTAYYFGGAHFNSLDMGLTFFQSLTVCALALGLLPETSPAHARLWIHAAWLSAALAMLTKGLVGIVLPAGALAAYVLAVRDRTVLTKLYLRSGVLLFLLVAAPWFIAVARANPEFARFFFIHEHFDRFLTTVHGRYQPWWFFIPVLLLGLLPWTSFAVQGAWQSIRSRAGNAFQPEKFLAAWIVVVMVFFSASDSKLIGYVLPVVPALALLCGRYLDAARPAAIARHLLAVIVLSAVGAAVAALAPQIGHHHTPPELASVKGLWLTTSALVLLTGAVAAYWLARARRVPSALIALTVAAVLANQAALAGLDALASYKSSEDLARQILPRLRPDTAVYVVRTYPQSLPFYLDRTVTLVDFRGELDLGLKREPGKALASLDAFLRRWSAEPGAVAVMSPETFDSLTASGVPMKIIGRNASHVAVRRP